MVRDALRAESVAAAEAAAWKQKAERWQQRYEQQEQLVAILRSQSSLSAAPIQEEGTAATAELSNGRELLSAFSQAAAVPKVSSPPVSATATHLNAHRLIAELLIKFAQNTQPVCHVFSCI